MKTKEMDPFEGYSVLEDANRTVQAAWYKSKYQTRVMINLTFPAELPSIRKYIIRRFGGPEKPMWQAQPYKSPPKV